MAFLYWMAFSTTQIFAAPWNQFVPVKPPLKGRGCQWLRVVPWVSASLILTRHDSTIRVFHGGMVRWYERIDHDISWSYFLNASQKLQSCHALDLRRLADANQPLWKSALDRCNCTTLHECKTLVLLSSTMFYSLGKAFMVSAILFYPLQLDQLALLVLRDSTHLRCNQL